jgi:hypothetical protein
MSRTTHLCIDLRGALMNWEDRMWRKCVTADDGHTMSPQEVKMQFLDELAKGKKVIPMDSSCDNFDFQKGCLGHERN